MKQAIHRIAGCACAGALILSSAPLVWAQTPAQAPSASAPKPPAAAAARPSPGSPDKITNKQASYLFGLTYGEQLRSVGVNGDIVLEALTQGLKEGLKGKKSTPDERKQVQEFAHTAMLAQAERNKSAARDFLERNGKKDGVQTTASGLQYKVEESGDAGAALITESDEVTVSYRGTLLDGTEFDSSFSRGVPATFAVRGVIKGWQDALVLMKPGAKWTLYVPPELAYGAAPRPGIPANSLLIFEVKVLGVKPKPPAPAPKVAEPQTPPATPPTSQ